MERTGSNRDSSPKKEGDPFHGPKPWTNVGKRDTNLMQSFGREGGSRSDLPAYHRSTVLEKDQRVTRQSTGETPIERESDRMTQERGSSLEGGWPIRSLVPLSEVNVG